MREFKKNTWTMIKRLSLGLALAVPGLYQGHAQAQSIVLNFNGTITAAPCLMRVTPSSVPATVALISGSTSTSINVPVLNYSSVITASAGDPLSSPITFKVDMSGPSGGATRCLSGTKFQVVLLATNLNSVDSTTLSGRNLLVNQTNAQVGIEIAARSNLNTTYTLLTSLPTTNNSLYDIGSLVSSQTGLSPVSPALGYFEFSVTPVRIAATGAPITQTTYGGSITLSSTYN